MKKVYIIAIVAAVLAGLVLYLYLGKLEQSATVEIPMETVLVAAVDIPAYAQITPEMLRTASLPVGSAHAAAAREMTEVVGKITESGILAGEQLFPVKLKAVGAGGSGLSYIIPTGMRALSIAVDVVSGVSGAVRQGDFIDILAYTSTSYPLEPYAEEAKPTGTAVVIAEDIQVIALNGQLTTVVDAENPNAGYSTMTLLVSPEDAMRILTGAKGGMLQILLRATGDHEPNGRAPIGSDDLLPAVLPATGEEDA